MDGLKDFRQDGIKELISSSGFKDVNVENLNENMEPSLNRLRKIMIVPYTIFVKPLGLQKYFPNATAAVELYQMAKKGLIVYNSITAIRDQS